jgi:hypothetical protein
MCDDVMLDVARWPFPQLERGGTALVVERREFGGL